MIINWAFLMAAGLLEIGWAISLKMTEGFTKLPYLAVNVCFGLAAAFCLAQAMRSIPLTSAYPIWKGLAIIGLFVWETFVDKQPFHMSKVVYAALIVIGIVGLKISSGPAPLAQ